MSSGLSITPGPGIPHKYDKMTCHIVGGGGKMLVYGGRTRPNTDYRDCDSTVSMFLI